MVKKDEVMDDRVNAFIADVAGLEAVAIHEGLPHEAFEGRSHMRERETKPVQQLHEYWFYSDVVVPLAGDAQRLSRRIGDRATFVPWTGEKLCGGFHPDYAVEWRAKDRTYLALLCFGCEEAKLFGPGISGRFDSGRYDLRHDAAAELRAMLAKYDKHRPPTRYQ